MAGHMFEFVLQFFFGHVDFFFGRDAIDDQFRFYVILGAVFLLAPQTNPVYVDRTRIDSLLRQRTDDPFEPHIHLMFDK